MAGRERKVAWGLPATQTIVVLAAAIAAVELLLRP